MMLPPFPVCGRNTVLALFMTLMLFNVSLLTAANVAATSQSAEEIRTQYADVYDDIGDEMEAGNQYSGPLGEQRRQLDKMLPDPTNGKLDEKITQWTTGIVRNVIGFSESSALFFERTGLSESRYFSPFIRAVVWLSTATSVAGIVWMQVRQLKRARGAIRA